MKLISLTLKQFKGTESFSLVIDGQNATVYGQNGSGKSTLADAFLWLLTGKNSNGETLDPFPLDENGNRKHQGQEPAVEAEFSDNAGERFTLKRSLIEKWVKQTGHTERNYTGDETKCWIDGVPNKIGDYNNYVERVFASDSILRLLTNTAYFNTQIKKEERRKLLFETFGDMADSEILADTKELASLAAEVGKKTVDDYQKMVKERYTAACKQIELILVRIDEAAKSITDGLDKNAIEEKMASASGEISRLKNSETNDHDNVDHILGKELQSILNEISTKKSTWEQAMDKEATEHVKAYQTKIHVVQARVEEFSYAADSYSIKIKRGETRISELNADISAMRKKWAEKKQEWESKNAESFSDENVNCPTCGQSFPAEKISEMEENWNQHKAEHLAQISAYMGQAQERGKESAAELEKCKVALSDLKEKQDGVAEQLHEAAQSLKEAQEGYKPYEPDNARVEAHKAEINALEDKAATVKTKLEKLTVEDDSGSKEVQAQISVLESKLAEQQSLLAKVQLSEEVQKRINEYGVEQKNLGAVRDHAEKMLYLCDQFVRIKSEKITDNINRHFAITRFSLFETLKNGGLRQICEASVDGVDYGQLNKARQIAASIDIITTFSKAMGVSLPLFIDNSESVLTLYGVDTQDIQIIRLAVSEQDKTLMVQNENR